jgi:hypothetical protein
MLASLASSRVSLPEHFIYFVCPQGKSSETDFLIIQSYPGLHADTCVKAKTLGQARRALMYDWFNAAIIDTSNTEGRNLLYRLIHGKLRVTYDLKQRIYLCSLLPSHQQKLLKIRNDCESFNKQQQQQQQFKSILENTPRSLGGLRCYSKADGFVVKTAKETKPHEIDDELIKKLYHHPLCFIPRFFVAETARIASKHVNYDAKHVERWIVEIAAALCRILQDPFPIPDDLGSLLIPTKDVVPDRPETLKDFIFTLLDQPDQKRAKLIKQFPNQCNAILIADRFLSDLQTETSGIFSKNNETAYNRINSFFNLILGYWIDSFYTSSEMVAESFIDYSILRDTSQESLKFVSSEIRAEREKYGSTYY